jgi:hypothetical protein
MKMTLPLKVQPILVSCQIGGCLGLQNAVVNPFQYDMHAIPLMVLVNENS